MYLILDSFINYQWTWVIFVVGEKRGHHLFHQQEPAKVPWVCFAATLFFVFFVFLSPWTYASSKREVALCNMEFTVKQMDAIIILSKSQKPERCCPWSFLTKLSKKDM